MKEEGIYLFNFFFGRDEETERQKKDSDIRKDKDKPKEKRGLLKRKRMGQETWV